MSGHEDFLLLAARRISEPLSQAEDAELEVHLAGCPSCRSIVTGMRRDDILLRAGLSPSAASPRVRQRVLDEASGVRRPDWRLVLAVAATLLVSSIGMSFIVGGRPPAVPPPATQVSVPSLPSTASVVPTAVAPSPSVVSSGAVEPSPAALPTGTGPFAAANYTYGQLVRRDSIAARLENGEPTGEWWRSTTRAGQPVEYGGPVTCLVISGDEVWLAGRATTATDGRPDLAMFFYLHDGGATGEGDTAVGYLSNPGQTLATMEGWCRTKFIPAGPYPLTSGDVVVDDGRG